MNHYSHLHYYVFSRANSRAPSCWFATADEAANEAARLRVVEPEQVWDWDCTEYDDDDIETTENYSS